MLIVHNILRSDSWFCKFRSFFTHFFMQLALSSIVLKHFIDLIGRGVHILLLLLTVLLLLDFLLILSM